MKKTTKPCFSSGSSCVGWIERNCDQCVKGQHYNERTKSWSKVRCSIQRDILIQFLGNGNEEINLQSWEATHTVCKCPHFSDTRKKGVYKHRDKPDEPKLFKS